MNQEKRYILIDGHSLAYRAYYALPLDLATSSGQVTNAVYGFVAMLFKILEEYRPFGVMVAFDKGKPTYRLEQYADYKAQRPPMPDTLKEQIEIIKGLLEVMGIARVELEGFEADDVLATLAFRIQSEGEEALIVTSDKDTLQLVGDHIKVVANRKGITDIILYDRGMVINRYGVPPEKMVDYLALKGDASDNIPGVPGIGEKTAASLIQSFGGVDQILDRLGEIKSEKLRRAIQENRETLILSRELARLVVDLPIENDPHEFSLKPWNREDLRRALEALEFHTMLPRAEELFGELFQFAEEPGDRITSLNPSRIVLVEDVSGLEEFEAKVKEKREMALFMRMEGSGYSRGRSMAAAIAIGTEVYCFSLGSENGKELFGKYLGSVIGVEKLRWKGHNAKEIQIQLSKMGLAIPTFDFDSELAAYLLEPASAKYTLEDLIRRYLGVSVEIAPLGQLNLEESVEGTTQEDAQRVLGINLLEKSLVGELEKQGMAHLLRDMELPLQRVLALMEVEGVSIDVGLLVRLSRELQERLESLKESIYQAAGESFNINSPQQLSKILYDKLGLPPAKKIKTGYATDIEALESIKDQHPVVNMILEYRELTKLKSTYLDALPPLVDPHTRKLHTSFNQTVTATGRLSSSNPNLQNIPVRTELGSLVRGAFIPSHPDNYLLVADYSQIELRILAHLSGDENLVRLFKQDTDIHAATAAEVFGLEPQEVTPDYRRRAKAINFGIIYGISPYGLAKQIGVSSEEAGEYIERYFKRYTGVKAFLDRQVEEASSKGYVETIMGRRRSIPELSSPEGRMRSLGARLAMNSPIQGSAADIIKMAMITIQRELEEREMRSKLILQVHDELLLDACSEELVPLERLVRERMEKAVELKVPIRVDIKFGKSWREAKG